MKKHFLLFLLSMASTGAYSQALSLAECQRLAMEQSPLQQQKTLITSVTHLQNENLAAAFLPKLSLAGQATWQSDVITFPEIGSVSLFPEIPHFQFNTALNANQIIFDGGAVKLGKEFNAVSQQVQTQEVEVEINRLKEVINDLYFSILLLDKNENILKQTLEQLAVRRASLESAVRNGVMLKSNLDVFTKQMLLIEQKMDQIRAERQGLIHILEDWTGRDDLSLTTLVIPDYDQAIPATPSGRPEYSLFDLQQKQLLQNSEILKARTLPLVSAFLTAGIGQPNPFNFLKTDPSPFMQAGVKFVWTPWDWNQTRRDKEIISVRSQMVNTRRLQFDQNVEAGIRRDEEMIQSLYRQIEKDREIISLQKSIVDQVNAQFENGVVTSADYLAEVTALTEAQINLETHTIQQARAKVNILTKMGGL
ncbi:MAG: TolC family protein [Bacteroidia bacterium]|nr:TolC family protein [Bacteroidia bacterium]